MNSAVPSRQTSLTNMDRTRVQAIAQGGEHENRGEFFLLYNLCVAAASLANSMAGVSAVDMHSVANALQRGQTDRGRLQKVQFFSC